MLATFEHIPETAALARECARVLRPGGVVVITVPSPRVDAIVETLVRLRLADGMSLDEHHGYNPSETPALFDAAGCALVHRQRFQLGLNYLFVFRKMTKPATHV
jgi:SAM-dependent methyltransferase